ncbi:MAG: tryptophan synthase subunit alpha [Oscillospiraceae bacterium]|jgi:tryptophan synthase alpha chain|nr:tryptophan synthase subunit alpha [Oscillospiraceae bacterium]
MNNSKISNAFRDKKAFVAYIMAGDPSLEKTREYVLALERAGADVIELGIPFSDPIAEGGTIQAANLRAFQSNTTIEGIFETALSLRGEVRVPLLFMTYLNPVFAYGYDAFFARCAECGISGIIIPDLPFDESDEVREFTTRHGIELISLIAPTSRERTQRIAKGAEGFVYLVSSLGVTGARSEITTDIGALVDSVREHTDIPIAVGFGVHSPRQAAEIWKRADGVIVGSAIVSIIAEHGAGAGEHIEKYVRDMTKPPRGI